jgi:hypothetical protein
LTLRSAIAKHFTADLATVQVAAANRESRLRDYRDFFETTLNGLRRKYFLVPGKDPQAAAALVSVLLKHGIEVRQIPKSPQEKTMPVGGRKHRRVFSGDTAQPYGGWRRHCWRPRPENLEFLKRQDELRKQNEAKGTKKARRDYEFYDVTAWSLPGHGCRSVLHGRTHSTDLSPVVSGLPKHHSAHAKGRKE